MPQNARPTMEIITIRDEPAATVTARGTMFTERFSALPQGHPDLRLALWKAQYARDVLTGELPGPFTDHAAERYARDALIPAETFHALAERPDRVLADHFRVPIEQIALRRQDGHPA